MASLRLRGISKGFGATPVLRDIDLDVADGEFVAFVGPSGCGKSTLLRTVAGLEMASAGDIVIGGRRVNDVPPRARDVAMVFQSYALYPHMDVAANMDFALRLRRLPADTIADRLAEAARMLGLSPLLQRRPAALSGGQRQRTAMGRAIVRNPALFLFDEPLSNLDAKLRVQMRGEIRRLHARLGITSLYVTHDQVEAMTMADRIVVLDQGRISQAGPPLELYDRPANLFVAGFIGSPAMNLVEAEAQGTLIRAPDGSTLPCPGPVRPGPVVWGVRPEHLAVAAGGDGLAARVEVVEPTGHLTYLVATAAGVQLTAALSRRELPRPGETIRLRPDPARVHLFDPATGSRLATGVAHD